MPRITPLLVGAVVLGVSVSWPAPASAQTPYVPYFGKNRVRYDRFQWSIYKTDHFEIYFYPETKPQLERVAAYAESAYQHVSATLKHDLADKVPLIIYKTESEFQEQNVSGGELPEGVLAFAEPERNRMVLPIDEPSDRLYQLITHELTHIFEFDIIPRGIGLVQALPLWMDEGLSDYMTGAWNPLDLMQVRDAALTDNVPKMSEMESAPLSGRLPYSLGHATFEFIESRWGMDGVRQFLFSLRKSVIGGGDSAYEEALKLKPEEFDEQFDRYLKARFKPFRDKERPADYGRNLAPRADKTDYVSVVSIDPSPTGDIIAAVVGNRHDEELDIILISAKDGQVIRNLTSGFDKDRGWEYISAAGGLRGNLVPWIGWAPVGDRLAYFVRTEKEKTLVVQNVVTGKVEEKIDLKAVDEPESPAFSPDGKTIAFSALQAAVTDIFTVDLATRQVRNITKDALADYAPTFSPDGKTIVCSTHVSGNDKLYSLDVATGKRTQLTFGAHDDTNPKYYDDHTLVFTSTAVDPKNPLPPEVARNGDIPNVWSLDLKANELKQWTDTATGNVSPVVLHQNTGARVAFVSYYKTENGIHIISTDKPVATAETSDFGSPGPVVDFQPPLSHTLLPDNIHRKGAWEKMSLDGRPPIGLGVTSGGNFYGNTEISFSDVLGDKQVNFYVQSVAQFRTTAFTYVNTERRLQYALQGFSEDLFYYGQNSGILYDPSLAPFVSRDLAQIVESQRGGTVFGIYPFNRYTRVELSTGYIHLSEQFNDPTLQDLATQYQVAQFGHPILNTGHMLPLGVSFIQETTIFRDYGPVAGNTFRFDYQGAPHISDAWISRQTIEGDVRHYQRLAANGVFAVRLKGFRSWGSTPGLFYFGGNSELRGYDYLAFDGQKGFFGDAELRFPIIDAALTPFGVVGGLRGTFFVNMGAAGFDGTPFTPFTTKSSLFAGAALGTDASGNTVLVPQNYIVDGFRLVDGRASYGIGLESFLLGFPMHFDFSWKTLFNKQWEDVLFVDQGGSAAFRKMKFNFWIGYDF